MRPPTAYIVADLEGVSGVPGYDVLRDTVPGEALRRAALLELWLGEVNAAVAGVRAAGASEVVVLDNHGSGCGLPMGQLVEPARLVHGCRRPTWLPGLDASVGAVLLVGQHAMAGANRAHLAHTYSRRRIRSVELDGRPIGEIGLIVRIAAERAVPVVFASGDRAAADEARRWAPAIRCVETKEALSGVCCISRAPDEVRALIRTGAAAAFAGRAEPDAVARAGSVEIAVTYRRRDCWRVAVRGLLGRRRGLCWRAPRRLLARGASVSAAWDRLLGLAPEGD